MTINETLLRLEPVTIYGQDSCYCNHSTSLRSIEKNNNQFLSFKLALNVFFIKRGLLLPNDFIIFACSYCSYIIAIHIHVSNTSKQMIIPIN